MIFGIVMLANAVLNIFLIDYCCPTKTALGVSRLLLHVLNGVFNLVWLIIGKWFQTPRRSFFFSKFQLGLLLERHCLDYDRSPYCHGK